ncbi:MAG: DUF6473 family protein [Pseudomonadota bacterium]
MSFDRPVIRPDLVETYRFGRARQRYRSPRPDLDRPYIAMLGGSETYGKFVRDPYPWLVEETLGHQVANWGTPGAGPTFFLKDPVLLECCSNARICVISMMGASATSNRLFSVFKRRNERLRTVSEMLKVLYEGEGIEHFRFVHNMLAHLHARDPQKFKVVELEMRAAWIARMRELLEDIETYKVLFWFSERSPDGDSSQRGVDGRPLAPAYVDRAMIEAIAPYADEVVEYTATRAEAEGGPGDRLDAGAPGQAPRCHPGQAMHRRAAEALSATLDAALKTRVKRRWPI